MKPQDKLVSVVVVTYNGKDLAMRCLESLEQSDYCPLEAIVVDNSSSDGTVEAVRARFPQVRVICNKKNLMLAEARNIGIRESEGEFVFLVDQDNVIAPCAIGEMVDVIASNPAIGMVGPVAYYLCAPEQIWSAGSRMSMTTGLFAHLNERDLASNQSAAVEVLCFANAFMVRKSAVVKVGLFDSKRYPIMLDEADIGMRLRMAGYRVLLASKAKVYHDILPKRNTKEWLRYLHFGGVGDGGPTKAYFDARNRVLFMKQYAGRRFWVFLPFFLGPKVLLYTLLTVPNRRLDLLAQYLRGVKDGIVAVFGSSEVKA